MPDPKNIYNYLCWLLLFFSKKVLTNMTKDITILLNFPKMSAQFTTLHPFDAA